MWNGFYSLNHINDLESLKLLYKEALHLSYNSWVDEIKEGSFRRERIDMSCDYYIDNILQLNTHNVVIDRFSYYKETVYGEIGSCTLEGRQLFLFMYLSLENLQLIIDKYKLTKRLL
jgi:hypothetical protein